MWPGRLLAVKLVMADFGAAGFKVVGDLVIIMRGAAELDPSRLAGLAGRGNTGRQLYRQPCDLNLDR